MDEALDVVQRERQTETSLKEAFNFFFFFSGFSNKLFIAAVKYSSWEKDTRTVL